ncbi:hypothetical protein [Dyadobacter sp. CY323]|uniref:hypothetical protein n=1 Tax=Dyadobacter sp. CY323 TaxID=2907302 RepID=UPI001F19B416|nr:hypothetical protein [Dyadobacter sp. CY323]MCE6990995.1 hypothetical protein [Dyadobacter sp. CY323]
MPPIVDITDRVRLQAMLESLAPNTLPTWGLMTPQKMIEHLSENVSYTNGKRFADLDIPLEEALMRKESAIYGDFEMPRGIGGFGDPNTANRCADIPAAIEELLDELKTFDFYYVENPAATTIHSGFGPLTHNEWIIWHGKHFGHHFRQFRLI